MTAATVRLTPPPARLHHYPVALNSATGLGHPNGAAKSRKHRVWRLFSFLARPMGGPDGKPQGLPVLHRSSNPFGPLTRLDAWCAVRHPNWSTPMPRRTPKHTLRLVASNGHAVAQKVSISNRTLAADEQFLLTFYRAAPPRIRAILQRAASLMAAEAAR